MSTELALIQRSRESLGKPQKKDRDIWLMKKRGWSDDELAGRFGMKPDKIRNAIDRYELHRAALGNDEIDLQINAMAARVIPKVEKVITEGLKATTNEKVERGKRVIYRKVADHPTRIRTLDSFRALLESARPKGVGVQVNTQINNPAKEQPASTPKGFDFESRLRLIRAEKGLGNDESIPDAEYEDADEQESLKDELGEIGIDLEDDDEDDDE